MGAKINAGVRAASAPVMAIAEPGATRLSWTSASSAVRAKGPAEGSAVTAGAAPTWTANQRTSSPRSSSGHARRTHDGAGHRIHADHDVGAWRCGAACRGTGADHDAEGGGVGGAGGRAHGAARGPVRRLRRGAHHGAIARRIQRGSKDGCRHPFERYIGVPGGGLRIGEDRDLSRGNTRAAHERDRVAHGGGKIARTGERFEAIERCAHGARASANDASVGGNQPESITRGRAVDGGASGVLESREHRRPFYNHRRRQRVVEHNRERGRGMTTRREPSERARGGEGKGEHGGDAQEHEQHVPESQFAGMLLLRAQQIAHGREIHFLALPTAEEVEHQRDRGCSREQQRKGGKKVHGSA